MDRQEGYYWVKYRTGYQIAYWGEYVPGGEWVWYVVGNDELYKDHNFEHINEIRIKQPGELPD